MIVTIIQFDLDENIDPVRARSLFADSTGKFVDMPGLDRKYYLLSEDAVSSTNVYLWESREHAENLFTEDWKDYIREKYGHRPTVKYYDCLFVVDNVTNEVVQSDD